MVQGTLRKEVSENILHHTQRLRLSSLRLLCTHLDSNDIADETQSIFAKLLEAESIPLTLQGVRDRLLKIRRMELSVKSDEDARMAALWLLGRLTPHFFP